MSAAQALGYSAGANDLRFEAQRSGASAIFVGFNPNGTVDITSGAGFQNQTLTFGAGIYGETNLFFNDGTRSVIGSAGDDLLMGAITQDSLWAGPGQDTLNGSAAPDRLYGGAGADLFVVGMGETLPNQFDSVGDWEAIDRIAFGSPAASAGNYVELEGFATLEAATAAANSRIASGQADYVAAQVNTSLGSTVFVFADTQGRDAISGRIGLQGANLGQIDHSNIVATPRLGFPSLAPLPGTAVSSAAPLPVIYVGAEPLSGFALIHGNMDTAHVGDSRTGVVTSRDDQGLKFANGQTSFLTLIGKGLTYREDSAFIYDIPTGTIHTAQFLANGFSANLSGPAVAGPTLFQWLVNDSTQQMFATYLVGADSMSGDTGSNDLMRGFTGSDTMLGLGGNDTLWGGAGNDVLYAAAPAGRLSPSLTVTGSTYLRGEEGDDWIGGGSGFDDINGNMGADTAGGGDGEDWVVGGRDNDLLFGDAAYDLVYGNLGADTCDGGAGNDIVRGGQDDDVVLGGDGDDYVSGDKGSDTMTGGAGADIFHSFGDAGLDRVLDFSLAQGDRVQLDPGTQYTVSQSGADTVINMTGGGQMILVGVQMSSLTPGWIFGA
jgi:Ca2+-binding RTX toxin-like protein